MARRNRKQKWALLEQAAEHDSNARLKRLLAQMDLRDTGFSAAEIRNSLTRIDGVVRDPLEWVALAEGLASEAELASDVVARARNVSIEVLKLPSKRSRGSL